MIRFPFVLPLTGCLLAAVPQGRLTQNSLDAPPLDTHGVVQPFVRVPGGSFRMGSTTHPEEGPIRDVSVDAFDLAATEVTVRQFRAFVQATGYVTDAERAGHSFQCCWRPKLGISWRNPGFAQSDDDPVLAVSWRDASEYCRWLSRETGLCYRLPSEAEWEFAARRDQEGQSLGSSAWYDRNSEGHSRPVGTRAAGRLGLHDVLGNAWEWVEDAYHQSYDGAPATARPWNDGSTGGPRGWPKPGDGRVLRGGGWGLSDRPHPAGYEVTLTSRPVFAAADSCNNSGFRLARTIPPALQEVSPPPRRRTIDEVLGGHPVFIHLPAGAFLLGDDKAGSARQVRFPRVVRMMRDEVTVAQFARFVEASGYVTDAERKGWAWDSDFRSRHQTAKAHGARWSNPGFQPAASDAVTMVSWNDALAFCRWLSAATGANYRLPSEAEWEYAATAGGAEQEGADLREVAWYFDNSAFRTHPVGTRRPNAWGFRDMLGNASEWVLDTWWPDLSRVPADGSALLGLPTTARVVRGGSFERERNEFGLRARDWLDQEEAVAGAGFRVVDATLGTPARVDIGRR